MGRRLALATAAAACLCPALIHAQISTGVELLHYEAIVPRAETPSLGSEKPATAARRLSFDAFGRRFDVELEPNARLAAAARTLDLPAGVAAYRGALSASEGSWARIVTTPDGPAGLIFDDDTLYALERGSDSLADETRTVAFRLVDVYVAPGALGCGTADPTSAADAYEALLDEMTPLAAQSATLNLDIGAVADYEFYEAFGDDTEQALLTRLNNVDGIFSEQLGVQLTVAEVDVFTEAADPFTESAAGALLDELAVYRGATPAQDAQGLTHLFTGRDLDGSTAGIAYLGVVCSTRSPFDSLGRSLGAALSEGRRGSTLDSLVAAHEIGHNFGAPHDGESGSGSCNIDGTAVTCTLDDVPGGATRQLTLALQSATADSFAIDATVGAAEDADPGNDTASATVTIVPVVDLVLSGTALELDLDRGGTLEVALRNESDFLASTVALTANFSDGLRIDAATLASTVCTVAGQTIDCATPNLAARGEALLSIVMTGTVAGAEQATLTVTAAEDDDNDVDNSLVLAVEIVSPPAPAEVSGGTGAVSPIWLLAGALALLGRRRRLRLH